MRGKVRSSYVVKAFSLGLLAARKREAVTTMQRFVPAVAKKEGVVDLTSTHNGAPRMALVHHLLPEGQDFL